MFLIQRYTPEIKQQWDAFVDGSRNGTFLLKRDYMDYHSDRFEDHSLIVQDQSGNLTALLPANIRKDTLYSHQGLTYGGWILPLKKVDAADMVQIWQQTISFLRKEGINHIIYKAIPYIYHRYPCEDDLYGLWRNGATMDCVQISETITLLEDIVYNENTKRGIKSASRSGIVCRENENLDDFWPILEKTLQDRHKTSPVHTIEEMRLLKGRFPRQIKLWSAFTDDGHPVAGVLTYHTSVCVHAQYIAASDQGRQLKALPLLFKHITDQIKEHEPKVRFFDFGTCNEDHGRILNAGLVHQKTGLGGRPVNYITYALDIRLKDYQI